VKKTFSQSELKEIVKKYCPIVSLRVRKSLGTHIPDWEDVVNEIMVNTLEKIKSGKFRGDSSIGTFIYTITSRRIVDFIRKKNKVLQYAPEPSSFPAPNKNIESKERSKFIAKYLKNLQPKYREIIYLYYYKELTRQEVAKKIGIPPRRVSERANYARKLLKKMMKK
jgi:RNA polymerase sigma-70 factor (ECF subfamily)